MGMRRHRIARVTAAFTAVAAVAAMLAGCGATHEKRQVASDAAPSGAAGNGAAVTPAPPSPTVPLRRGERHVTLWLPTDYRPAAPSGGTDDYRCFLLDPKLTHTTFVTGAQVLPDNPALVHHAILYRVEPMQVAAATAAD